MDRPSVRSACGLSLVFMTSPSPPPPTTTECRRCCRCSCCCRLASASSPRPIYIIYTNHVASRSQYGPTNGPKSSTPRVRNSVVYGCMYGMVFGESADEPSVSVSDWFRLLLCIVDVSLSLAHLRTHTHSYTLISTPQHPRMCGSPRRLSRVRRAPRRSQTRGSCCG